MTGIITFKIENLSEIKKAFKKAPEVIGERMNFAVAQVLIKLENTTKKMAPVNKQTGGGNLRQSIKNQMTGFAKGELVAGAKYALYVHEGTKPHIIRPRIKKGLANKRTGQYFGKIVHHPGTKANPFLENAIVAEREFINNTFNEVLKDII